MIYRHIVLRRILDSAAARRRRSTLGLIRDAVHIVPVDHRSVEADLAIIRATSGAWADRTLTAEQEVDRLRSGRRLSRELHGAR